MDIITKLNQFKASVKEDIIKVIKDIYLKQNNGLHPNFEYDEEYILFLCDLKREILINVECRNTDDSTSIEKWCIYNYIVTLDDNLMFRCGDDEDEFDWTELSTDELVGICNFLQSFYKKMN